MMNINELKYEVEQVEIVLGDQKVKIKQYLSSKDKIKFFEAIQEECLNQEIINQVKLDALFNAFIIINYTDIEFDGFESDQLLDLYDYFEVNGYMSLIIKAIPRVEYEALTDYLKETVNDYNRYKVSILGTIESVAVIAPALMEKISEISKDIDINNLQTIGKIYSNFK